MDLLGHFVFYFDNECNIRVLLLEIKGAGIVKMFHFNTCSKKILMH